MAPDDTVGVADQQQATVTSAREGLYNTRALKNRKRVHATVDRKKKSVRQKIFASGWTSG
jgi:hypothetical protein